MKQNCGAQWQDPVFHNDQTYKQQQKIWEVRKGLWKVLPVFSSRSYTHTHTHELYVQNVTPATENLVVYVTITVENRTQKTVLNYCAQAKAVLQCVQTAGLSDEQLHWSGRETAFILILCIHLRLGL